MRTLLLPVILLLATPAAEMPAVLAAPPEADAHFGTATHGGRGGQVIRVTNLNASGRGSLRDALWKKGPRIIVFEVGGVIDLDAKSLNLSEPYCTIAGQTAPSPGITLIRGGLSINSHDVIVQHLKVRPGDAGGAKGSGWEADGISVNASQDVIVDHCSCTWSTDENLSVSGPRFEGNSPEEWRRNTSRNIWLSNCIVAEALSESTHAEGEHSKGTLLHDNVTGILVSGNLYACNKDRNPFAKRGTTAAVINNWIVNPGSKAVSHGGPDGGEWKGREPQTSRLFVIGNLFEHGSETIRNAPLLRNYGGPVELSMRDNRNVRLDGKEAPQIDGPKVTIADHFPKLPEGFVVLPVGQVKEGVLKNAGARPWDRDPVDARILKEAAARTGRIIDSQEQVGGYPVQEAAQAPFQEEDWDLETLRRR